MFNLPPDATSFMAVPSGTTEVDCTFSKITSFAGLPDSVTKLVCSYMPITSFEGVPAGLEWLDCSGCKHISSFIGLAHTRLTYVNCGSCTALASFDGLPDTVTVLDSNYSGVNNLTGLPAGLRELSIQGSEVTSVAALAHLPLVELNIQESKRLKSLVGLPPTLERLNCSYCSQIVSTEGIPSGLRELACIRTALPSLAGFKLESVKLGGNRDRLLATLEPSIKTLSIAEDVKSLAINAPSIETLICASEPLTSLKGVPENVRHLKLDNCRNLKNLAGLPPRLLTLDINNCAHITSLAGLPLGLRELDCTHTGIKSLRGIRVGLRRLRYTREYITDTDYPLALIGVEATPRITGFDGTLFRIKLAKIKSGAKLTRL